MIPASLSSTLGPELRCYVGVLMSCDVLNLEWSSYGRDREVASLVCAALRHQGRTVVEDSIFNYRHLILKHRPRVLYVAEPAGARLNLDAARFALRLGIPTVSLDAEGNYVDELAEQMFWGHVKDNQLPQQAKLMWSARSREMVLSRAPDLSDRLKVSGAVGFDRYILGSFATKEQWRERYGFDQQHLVGYAGWAFDYVFGTRSVSQDLSLYGPEAIQRFRRDRESLRDILEALIESNPKTLFVLRQHPGVVDVGESELAGLEQRTNVLVPPGREPIADCINVCDLWSAYDSTTCLEAWLLDKPSLLMNPSGPDFPRSRMYLGSSVLRTYEEINDALRAHRLSGDLPGFSRMTAIRQKIISDTIQWADGKNHLRAAYYIEHLIDSSDPRPLRPSRQERYSARHHNLLYRGASRIPRSPGFRSYSDARKRFDHAQLNEATARAVQATATVGPGLSPEDLAQLEEVNR